MTIKPASILRLLVLAAIASQPLPAAAQGTRTPASPAPATATGGAPAARPAAAIAPARPWNEQEYRLGPGDELRVDVYKQADFSQSLQVRPDGKITLPLVGDIAAAGRTSIELRDSITESLKEYITNPVVTVIVQKATSAQVYLIGEVVTPGTQIMQGPLTALQALAQAGGLKEFADRGDIRILRKTATGTQTIPFDYKAALKGKADPLNLQPGDTIVVP
jgi:polysaccharide export outer membrane protein